MASADDSKTMSSLRSMSMPNPPLDTELSVGDISQYISVPLIVTTTDGRQFHGPLIATDREQNIILGEATEKLPIGFKSRRNQGFRYVGMIVVPGKYILRIDADMRALRSNLRNGRKYPQISMSDVL
ncbi:hypothetical protein V1525DRAFT_395161 [Lipomyces kononenkoae]|uniref:Uncharacterized protein n=1 Tax=Lipomyces kononenkoae TaxID=34357 RepID=A0ACC3T989_LIPKO